MAYRDLGVGLVPGFLLGHRRNFRISMGVSTETLEGGLNALGQALKRR